jgi:hypothetical protein
MYNQSNFTMLILYKYIPGISSWRTENGLRSTLVLLC